MVQKDYQSIISKQKRRVNGDGSIRYERRIRSENN